MAGILSADRIIESEKINQKIQSIGVEITKLLDLLDQVAVAGSKITTSLGSASKLSDFSKINKETAINARNLAIQQKAILDIEAKVVNLIEKEAKARSAETQATIKQIQAIIAEERAKQAKIATDTKVINQIKAEQTAINAETQARIKNAQLIAAQERAKQAKIRTDRLEEQGIRKSGSAFRGLITSMRDYLTLYVGISQATQLVKSIFNTTRTLDSLDFAIKKVITDQVEFAQTQQFLSKITDAYGAELITTTERYIKFRAASQQSNISANQTQKIFESVTKTAGVLGLKTDELTGVYLALEQMMSKGKVTTEELRRQLGERLPGAFGIMAKALGVTIPELDKMLKKGEVLSTEALPKFAEQLEKSFGIENVTRVETLAAAQNRYTIAFQETVKAMESSDFFISVIESATNSLKGLRDMLKGVDEEFIRGKSSSEIYANNLISIAETAGDKKRYEAAISGIDAVTAAEIQKAGTIEELNKILIREQENATKKAEELKAKDAAAYGILTKAINENRGELLKQLNSLDAIEESSTSSAKSFVNMALKIDLFNQKIISSNKSYVKDLILQSNSIEILKSKIKELTEVKKEDTVTPESDAAYKLRIKRIRESYEKELAEFKRFLQFRLNEEAKALDETYADRDTVATQAVLYEMALEESKFNVKQETIDKEIELNNKLLRSVRENGDEREQIITKIAQLEEQKEQNITDFQISNDQDQIKIRKANNKQRKIDEENLSNELLAIAEENTHEQSLIILDAAQKEILASRGKANKIKAIEDQLTLDLIANERDKLNAILETGNLTVKDAEQVRKRINNLNEAYETKLFDIDKETEEKKADLREQTVQRSAELLNEGFNIANKIYEAQLINAEQMFKSETEAAGDNLEEQIIAKRKYEQESNKIRRRQAIAEKAQAAMNIALNTAMAIISIWAQVPKFDFGVSAGILTALVSGIGALQLATVLATPIPAFFKGTENAPETFIAGDTPDGKGASEMIIKPSGEMLLTPSKATLFSDKSFIGSKILPHDKTNEMLANYAVNQGASVFVDMSGTNKYLNQIAQNTKNNEISGTDSRGRQFIKRGSVTTHY